ncbi:polyprotein [Oriximina virus]|uniref:Envelopment polyprotein n=1 Tax=Oriximina virus TaxID=655691 RepID=F2W3T7_9VIRU|nr:polyprotein [Oriximina virus]AEA30053.1 polyprotein [Oriximina virus]
MNLISFILNVVVANAAYTIKNWGLDGSESTCLSNESPLEGLIYYWEQGAKKRGLVNDFKSCKIGSEPLKEMRNKTVMRMIEEVQLSMTNLRFTCSSNMGSHGVYVDFNGLDDTEPGKNIVDCEKFHTVSELGIEVSDGHLWDSRYNESYAAEIRRREMDLEKANSEKKNMEIMMRDDKNEILSLIRENQMLQHKISNLTGVMFNYNNSLDALAREMSAREEENANLLMDMREKMKEKDVIIRKQNDSISLKSVALTALVATTIIPLVSGSSQTAHINMLNSYPHAKNRIGGGLYRYDESEDEDTCKGLDYGLSCLGFDHMLKPHYYPFFNSHVMHLTPLEAFADKIIESENVSCEMGKDKNNKCIEGREFIRGHCPNGINGVYYINDKGKLSHSKCKEEGHEITEDCMFCRKIKKRQSSAKQVMKTSVSLQDAICQKESNRYEGPKIVVKGVCSIGNFVYKRCESSAQSYENVPFVTFEGKGKFYLEKLILSNVELMNNVSFVCYEHKWQDGVEVDNREWKRVNIKDCKAVDNTKQKICAGDNIFCQKYTCSAVNPSARCFMAPGSGPILVNILGSWVKPQCVGYETVLVTREVKSLQPQASIECDSCIYECGPEYIRLTSTGFEITSAVSCSHGSCISTHQAPSTMIDIPYPGMSAAMGGDIGIYVSHTSDSVSLHVKAHCNPRDSCEVHHCTLCVHGLLNYQCHSIASSLFLSTLMSMVIYFLLSLVGKLLYFFKMIPKKLRSPFMWIWLLISHCIHALRSILSKGFSRLNNTIGWREDIDRAPLREVRVGRAIPRFGTTAFLVLILLPLALGCSETLISNSKQVKCVQYGGGVKCSVSATISLKAGVIGGESCFVMKGPMEGQQKTIRIKTIASEMICREGTSFWTSHYTPQCMSSRRCHLVGECQKTRCQSWSDREVSKEFKGVSDNGIMSENKCFEQCGAIGCGCFNINPSCLFVHTQLKSTRNEAIRVFSCVDWVHRLTLEVHGPEGERDILVLGSLGTKFLNWGTVSLSLDAEGITGTNSISFLESSKGGFALYDEAISEIPREGFLGEVRCSSESAAIMAHASCLRAPNLIKYKPMTDVIDCTASLVDPFAAFYKGSLPQVRNGLTYTSSIDKKTVQAFNSGSIKAIITINMEDHEIQFMTSVIRCDATFINVTGCYSCNYGAKVCLKIKSSGNGEFLAREENGLFHMSLSVREGTDDYCQIQHFNKPEINERTRYTCGGEEKLLNIKGILISLGLEDLRNKTGGSSIVVNPSDASWSLSGWVSGLFSWLGGTWMAVLKILGFLLLGFLLLVLIISIIRFSVRSMFLKHKTK